MNKLCWVISLVLLLLVGAMGYMFVIRGSVAESDDGRVAILLPPGDRNFVLTEMRGFLEAVQAITEALPKKDMAAIAKAAHAVGMANAQAVPTSLMAKLPLEFKTLGLSTHRAFDELALDAKDMGDPEVVMEKLADILNNCTTCHAGYRIDPAPK